MLSKKLHPSPANFTKPGLRSLQHLESLTVVTAVMEALHSWSYQQNTLKIHMEREHKVKGSGRGLEDCFMEGQ